MVFLLFLAAATAFNAEEIVDGTDTENRSIKNITRSKYKIMSVFPDKVGSDGGDTIELKVSPEPNGVPFCKFDTWIVPGRKVSATGIQCNAPELRPGKVSVSVSFDKMKWSNEHVIEVTETSEEGFTFYLILIIGIISLAVVSVTLSKLYRKPKKKKIVKRKKRPVRSKSLLESDSVDGVHNRKANVLA